jgi:hypothetical protein
MLSHMEEQFETLILPNYAYITCESIMKVPQMKTCILEDHIVVSHNGWMSLCQIFKILHKFISLNYLQVYEVLVFYLVICVDVIMLT